MKGKDSAAEKPTENCAGFGDNGLNDEIEAVVSESGERL